MLIFLALNGRVVGRLYYWVDGHAWRGVSCHSFGFLTAVAATEISRWPFVRGRPFWLLLSVYLSVTLQVRHVGQDPAGQTDHPRSKCECESLQLLYTATSPFPSKQDKCGCLEVVNRSAPAMSHHTAFLSGEQSQIFFLHSIKMNWTTGKIWPCELCGLGLVWSS